MYFETAYRGVWIVMKAYFRAAAVYFVLDQNAGMLQRIGRVCKGTMVGGGGTKGT